MRRTRAFLFGLVKGTSIRRQEAAQEKTQPLSTSTAAEGQPPSTPLPQVDLPFKGDNMKDYYLKTFFPDSLASLGVHHFATAQFVKQVREENNTFVIAVDDVRLSPVVEVGSKVYVNLGATDTFIGSTVGGVVTKVNSNGTLGVLFDNNDYVLQLPQEKVSLSTGRSRFTLTEDYKKMLVWMKDAGVKRHGDLERLCIVLYARGWREKDLYMLEGTDIHCMVYLKRSVRVLVLEKAEWQRSHHAEMRTLLRERSKERSWRYFIQKYSGFISANFAGLGVLSVFLWNFKNYRKHQRSFQMNHAVKTMTDSVTKRSEKIKANIAANAKNVGATIASMRSHKTTEEEEKGVSSVPGRGDSKRHMSRRRVVEEDPIDRCVGESPIPGQVNYPQFSDARDCSGDDFVVEREEEERWLRRIIRQLDIQHPRITVVTGYHGCGKSTLVRTAVQKENNPSLFVEVRGKDDTLIAILRSLKVPNIDMCGDPTEFIAEVLARTTTLTRKTPIVVLSLRQGSDLKRVYAETVGLSCDRMLCHVVMEVALEKISLTDLNIPRMDFYKVPNFTPRQAFDFTENLIDPVAFQHFVEVMGTNSDEIGELYAAVVHQRMSPSHFTNLKLCKAMRQLQEAWEDNDEIQKVLYRLASLEYETGQHVGGDRTVLQSPQLSDIVLYDPVQHCWLFKRKVLHTAVRCLADPLLPPLS